MAITDTTSTTQATQMQSTILAKKPFVVKNGQTIVDITAPVVQYQGQSNVIDIILVDEDMSMRPDLVSYMAYGVVDYWDFILKFNGVSNPFSIFAGQYLMIPDLSYMSQQLNAQASANQPAQTVQNQYVDASKKSQIDPKKIIYDKMISNLSNQISKFNLPPNFAEPGKKEIDIVNGQVIFGGQS